MLVCVWGGFVIHVHVCVVMWVVCIVLCVVHVHVLYMYIDFESKVLESC